MDVAKRKIRAETLDEFFGIIPADDEDSELKLYKY